MIPVGLKLGHKVKSTLEVTCHETSSEIWGKNKSVLWSEIADTNSKGIFVLNYIHLHLKQTPKTNFFIYKYDYFSSS